MTSHVATFSIALSMIAAFALGRCTKGSGIEYDCSGHPCSPGHVGHVIEREHAFGRMVCVRLSDGGYRWTELR